MAFPIPTHYQKTGDAVEASRGERPSPFEARIEAAVARLEAAVEKLQPLLDQAAVYDRHRHRRREEGT